MPDKIPGYHGVLLNIDLSTRKVTREALSEDDTRKYIGGRGLGMKLLWDKIPEPGLDPLSPGNPLMFMPGPYSGFPIPATSRTCVVTKSPLTTAVNSPHKHASTVAYANMGGFFGPEIRFAGYDGIIITGKADSPVYIRIEDDKVEIKDARKYWGMKTNDFDKAIIEDLGDRRFETCCIGPAGEKLVRYSAIIHTSARAAARGGPGCVMGSKNLKAVAIRGTKMPEVADHKEFLEVLERARTTVDQDFYFRYGTAQHFTEASGRSDQTVKNFREGVFTDVEKMSAVVAEQNLWVKDSACYCCPFACHKVAVVREGKYAGVYHEGPEYETGTMLGPNLMISDLAGIVKEISEVDNYGLDAISTGNVIGFLMEAYDKKLIDRDTLDGIDLKWGDVDAVLEMIHKIGKREGIGDRAAKGVKSLAAEIGLDSDKFAIHTKGQELPAWNVYTNVSRTLRYVSSNKGACHLVGSDAKGQDYIAALDSLGLCMFAIWSNFTDDLMPAFLRPITGEPWTMESFIEAGERIFNIEKCFNYREGFGRDDDIMPDRFFEDPLTIGPRKGAVLDRKEFVEVVESYYDERGWDKKTTKPSREKLSALGLDFIWNDIKDI